MERATTEETRMTQLISRNVSETEGRPLVTIRTVHGQAIVELAGCEQQPLIVPEGHTIVITGKSLAQPHCWQIDVIWSEAGYGHGV